MQTRNQRWIEVGLMTLGLVAFANKLVTPEAAAKGIVDNAVSSSPSACQWIGGGAFGGWFISKMLWYTATVSNSHACIN